MGFLDIFKRPNKPMNGTKAPAAHNKDCCTVKRGGQQTPARPAGKPAPRPTRTAR